MAKDVPTSWTLTPPQLQVTEDAGRFLLRRHPCYRALLGDLHASQPPMTGESAQPAIPCATKIDIERRPAAPRPSSYAARSRVVAERSTTPSSVSTTR
jgi:hypothetical protein